MSDAPDRARAAETAVGIHRRSSDWFAHADLPGFVHRSSLTPIGLTREELLTKPVVGIANSWADYTPCNAGLRRLAEEVRGGVLAGGGIPLEFPTISLGENLMKPTTMLFRNLMSMDIEECIRGYPMDAVVLLGGCDKTTPAQVMGACSVDVPAIVLTTGPCSPPVVDGEELAGGHAVWRFVDRLRAGQADHADMAELESSIMSTVGHCAEMGTASTIASVMEALGLAPLGSTMVPAPDGRRAAWGRRVGQIAASAAAGGGPRPSQILTPASFDNAIALLMSLGGSTNAVLHLLAIAGRARVDLDLDRFDAVGRRVPMLCDLQPSGRHLVSRLNDIGGVPTVLNEIKDHLHLEAMTVTGRRLGEELRTAQRADGDVVRPHDDPIRASGGIAVLRGTLAPDGAVIKVSAASPELLRHSGRAIVFDSVQELAERIDDETLGIEPSDVLVLRNAGPRGGPGIPEWGMLPFPRYLLEQGVRDMVRVSDARMSGTAYGTAVLHASPESAVGGPLALVRTGDVICLDVGARRIDVLVEEAELNRRRARWQEPDPHYTRGWGRLFLEHVEQAHRGCDLDVLKFTGRDAPDPYPLGLFRGWIGGW